MRDKLTTNDISRALEVLATKPEVERPYCFIASTAVVGNLDAMCFVRSNWPDVKIVQAERL